MILKWVSFSKYLAEIGLDSGDACIIWLCRKNSLHAVSVQQLKFCTWLSFLLQDNCSFQYCGCTCTDSMPSRDAFLEHLATLLAGFRGLQ
jgi:hypothetical protein